MASNFTIKQIFQDHWADFQHHYPNIRPVVLEETEKMLACGDPAKGHAIYYCPHCFKFKYVPFRCKSRFCNTCGTAYQIDRADSISAKLINCKHRHIVFTIAEELRPFFRQNRKLLHLLFQAAANTVLSWFASLNKTQNFTPGMVCALHTFGRDLKWNPHIHMLVSEGASGNLTPWRHVHHIPFIMLRKKWQTALLSLLELALGKEVFSSLKKQLYKRYSDGFYVHAPSSDFNSPTKVADYITRYIGRPAMAQSRILDYDGQFVTFWYRRHEDDSVVNETLPVFDFIKQLIIHIPDKHFHQLRYYGLYAKHHKQEHKLVRLLSTSQVKVRRIFKRWVFRMEASFGFDPTKCSCGCYMEFWKLDFPSSIDSLPP